MAFYFLARVLYKVFLVTIKSVIRQFCSQLVKQQQRDKKISQHNKIIISDEPSKENLVIGNDKI